MKDIAEVYALRERRLKLQREADKLEQEEKDLLYDIQKELMANNLDVYSEDGYTVNLKSKDAPVVVDWAATLDYIRQTGGVDMLQKRLTDSAVKARWDSGVEIPGVNKTTRTTITITKD